MRAIFNERATIFFIGANVALLATGAAPLLALFGIAAGIAALALGTEGDEGGVGSSKPRCEMHPAQATRRLAHS